MTTGTDNPQVPSLVSETYQPDQLIAGRFPIVTGQNITLTGAAALKRGTVLGQVGVGGASSAAKTGGNTGVGTFVLDGTTPVLAGAKSGVYALRVLAAGRAQLKDPNGADLGEYDFSAGGNVTIADGIKGVLTDDGTTHFVAGDGFDITVAAGSGKYKKSVATATDGSQNPSAILADDADASGGDVLCGIYLTGEFNANSLIMDASWSVATLTPLLRPLQIHIRSTVSAAAPS